LRHNHWTLLAERPPWVEQSDATLYPFGYSKSAGVTGWGIESPIVDYSDTFPRLVMRVGRDSSYYVTNVILPVFLIIAISAVCFAIPDLGDRMQVVLTLLLTVVAFKFVITQDLPATPYMTYLDIYILVGYILMVLIVIENAIVNYMEEDLKTQVDFWSCVVFAAFWVPLHIFIVIGTKTNYFSVSWAGMEEEQQEETRDLLYPKQGNIISEKND
jgi:hypothetical protein